MVDTLKSEGGRGGRKASGVLSLIKICFLILGNTRFTEYSQNIFSQFTISLISHKLP